MALSSAHNDFRSDTFTTPTPSMLAAMTSASFGDDVYTEDHTTNEFQSEIARLTGKEDALFMLSGTMGNQIGIRIHLASPPHSVLCDYRAHVYAEEGSGLAVLSQAMVTPVHPANGLYLTREDVERWIVLGEDIHIAPTRVISLELTIGGVVTPIEEIRKISEFARENGIAVHCDGARLWNASAATGVSLAEYCQWFDSVSMCVSKGLGAPIGGVLATTAEGIKKARWLRKQIGGGIRQAGVLTAPALVGVREIWPTMTETHAKTKRLEADLSEMGVVPQIPVDTNFIFIDTGRSGIDMGVLLEQCEKFGVKLMDERIAMHHQISDQAIESLKRALAEALRITKELPEGYVSKVKKGGYGTLNVTNILPLILLLICKPVLLFANLLPSSKRLLPSRRIRRLIHEDNMDEKHHPFLCNHILATYKHWEIHPCRRERRANRISARVEPLVAEPVLLRHAPDRDRPHQTRMLPLDCILASGIPCKHSLISRNKNILIRRIVATTFVHSPRNLAPEITLVRSRFRKLEGSHEGKIRKIRCFSYLPHLSLRLHNPQLTREKITMIHKRIIDPKLPKHLRNKRDGVTPSVIRPNKHILLLED
ncbi:pyridoxal phosphate-dependent transferase [Aspergillus granulosus]|uniref:Pyridoxal phosphate-dependent transferase n=1 Tax=Aspergillus granulosus TaxID=176169 RepID=A0ABR4HQM3_9EURO